MSHGYSKMLSSIISCMLFLCMIDSALGHMQMEKPYPLRSQYNPKDTGPKDYDMSSPLSPSGSNYPCKGYNKDISGVDSVETYTAGQSYSITLLGGASHMGGSCQISLSYDNGATFKVIHSMIGGCPLKTSYDFTVPKDAPNGKKVLLAWTWFNKVGNREMYMNCAVVDIVGGSNGQTLNTPDMFRANSFGGTCITPESVDFVFENPGDSVEYGGDYATKKPSGPTPITGCANAPPPPPPSQDKLTTTTTQQGQPATTNNTSPTTTNTSPTTTENTSPTTTNVPPPPPGQDQPTTQQGQPTTTGNTYPTTGPAPVPTTMPTTQPESTTIESQPTTPPTCKTFITTVTQIVTQTITQTQTEVILMTRNVYKTKLSRTVRPTTTQYQNSAATPTGGPCNKAEAIQCYEDGKKWKFCDGTEWVDMGLCAKGQMCKDGKLV